jgi:hypothetical protein
MHDQEMKPTVAVTAVAAIALRAAVLVTWHGGWLPVIAQVAGAFAGVMAAHVMFGLALTAYPFVPSGSLNGMAPR